MPLTIDTERGLVPCIAETSGRDAIGMAGGLFVTETMSERAPLAIGRPAGNGGGSLLLNPNDNAERLILSRAAADGSGGTPRGSSDCRDRSVEWSVCLRAGSRGGKEGRGASISSFMDPSWSGETLSGPEGALLWYLGFSAEYFR